MTSNDFSGDGLKVLLRTDRLAVVVKPEGMMVHRTKIASHETVFLVDLAREQFGCRIHPVHRLDRGTSGALLLAFDAPTASVLGEQMMAGAIRKTYLAVVRGWMSEERLIDKPLGAVKDEALGRQVEELKPASTRILPLATATVPVASAPYEATRLSLIAAQPLTGRRHQIRRHLKSVSHPIIGDATYGKGPLNRALAGYFGEGRLMLHSAGIAFRDPETGEELTVRAPLEGAFRRIAQRLGWMEATEDPPIPSIASGAETLRDARP